MSKQIYSIPAGKEIDSPYARRPRKQSDVLERINAAANKTNKIIPASDDIYLRTTGNQSRDLAFEALSEEDKEQFLQLESDLENLYAKGRDELRLENLEKENQSSAKTENADEDTETELPETVEKEEAANEGDGKGEDDTETEGGQPLENGDIDTEDLDPVANDNPPDAEESEDTETDSDHDKEKMDAAFLAALNAE